MLWDIMYTILLLLLFIFIFLNFMNLSFLLNFCAAILVQLMNQYCSVNNLNRNDKVDKLIN